MLIFRQTTKNKSKESYKVMPEQLQTRDEHSRSVEDAEKYRAIHTLTELGMLTPLSEVETFHGRVGFADAADWEIDPGFANGSNDSGNNNVNNRPSLYTGEKVVAEDFSTQRAREIGGAKLRQTFMDRVENYSPEEKQAWLDRANQKHQAWYDGLASESKRYYPHMLDENGRLKPKTFDDLRPLQEARRLEEETPDEEKRAIWQQAIAGIRPEIHNIVAADSDATVLDFGFDASTLSEADAKRYEAALETLFRQTPITEGSPLSFNDRHATAPLANAVRQRGNFVIADSDVSQLAKEAAVSEQTALQFVSAYNAGQISRVRPSYLIHSLLKSKEDISVDELDVNGEKQKVPINLEYVQRYLRNAHIFGVKQNISSATLGRDIVSVSLLDLEKTSTETGLQAERAGIWQKLGGLAAELSQVAVSERVSEQHPLLRLLTDPHAKPQKLVDAAKQVEGYDKIFDGDAGNWEGFTLAEHTETVLRNFDESFADKVPVELIAPMRLAILSHDVGKPIAAANGDKHNQKQYNVVQADDFLTKLGVEDKMKNLLIAMIGDGEELAFRTAIRREGEPAEKAMQEFAVRTLREFNGGEEVSDAQIESFTEMCKMLQVSDGGAYTSMAVTRSQRGPGRYRNAPSFNSSFAEPQGFGKRTIRLREDGQPAAPQDLTPQGKQQVSRVKISQRGAGRKAPNL